MRSILVVQRSANEDGSAISGLMLTDGFRSAGWRTLVVFGFDGPVIDRYRKRGHKVCIIPHDNWLRDRHYLRFCRNILREVGPVLRLRKLIRCVQPDLVYINSAVSLAGAVAARIEQVPSVWHMRELFDEVGGEVRAPTSLVPFVRRTFQRLPSRIVVNSPVAAQNLLGRCAESVTVVPNAVESAFFAEIRTREQARIDLGLPEDAIIIGVPGTLRPAKGHAFFLRAMAPLLRERDDVLVALTGTGESHYRGELDVAIAKLDLQDRVAFTGSILDMCAFYRAVDVAVVPSAAESFGRTVIESMAVGTPVVATAVGGICDLVTDGYSGLLVPYGNERKLRLAVSDVLCHSTRAADRAEVARTITRQRYHEQIYQSRLVNIASELLRQVNHREG